MKLSEQQANQYVYEAWKLVYETNLTFPNSKYRLGQALCNVVPDEYINHVYQTENDWYYWEDSVKVTNTFYELCVE